MRFSFIWVVFLAVCLSSVFANNAMAVDARNGVQGDPYELQRQAFCPGLRGTLRGCFRNDGLENVNPPPAKRGLACVYYPCYAEKIVVICDPSNIGENCEGGIGEYPNDMTDPYDMCRGCQDIQCAEARRVLRVNHEQYERAIMVVVSEELRKHRIWLRTVLFRQHILPALAKMTTQLTAIAHLQLFQISQFFDADMQLKTQRTLHHLKIQAHEDYRPSETYCAFGTLARSLTATEKQREIIPPALSAMQMGRELRNTGAVNAPRPYTVEMDQRARWNTFRSTYCTSYNNAGDTQNLSTTGLAFVCGNATVSERVNKDLNYASLIDEPRTLDVSFTEDLNDRAQDILALSYNLYGHDILSDSISSIALQTQSGREKYYELRSITAKRGIARHSYNSIVALKTKGNDQSTEYIVALLGEFGMSESEAIRLIGIEPSYYAQLEILAQKMYQNPQFYVNLYDTPVNVKRKYAAMLAIERMLDHEIQESQLRQEMMTSVLLSSELREDALVIERKL